MRSRSADSDGLELTGGERAECPGSQRMPRVTQLEHGASLLQRSFRDLQKRQETGL